MSKLIKIALGAAMAAFVAFPAWADDLLYSCRLWPRF